MITATITRPTSIAPTTSCDQKIYFVETVDIGPLLAPGPREISLEPISRRSRRRRTTTRTKEATTQDNVDPSPGNDTRVAAGPLPDESASQCGTQDHHTNAASPRSLVPSEIQSTTSAITSSDSTISSSTGLSFRLAPAPSSAKSARDSKSSKASANEKTITATIELLKSGCLPGDNLPLKISIRHTKAIKSMHGIIITLYRQGRIDSAPPLSLFSDIKGKEAERLKHEEYYPKSKTGLSGLSLSSAGSSSMFRKDLAQTFAPILVDPVTLATIVHASVRVPEDVFPTISDVPGEMISFKYYIEVIVDLGGKLAGQQRHVPRVGAITVPTSHGNTPSSKTDGNSNMLAAFGGSLVDTAHIRREKSVVACFFDVVVGTKDSARDKRRGNNVGRQADCIRETQIASPAAHEPIYEEEAAPGNAYERPYPYQDEYYNAQHPEYYSNESYDYQEFPYDQYPPPAHAQIPVPLPEIQSEEYLSEKERARLAEERLLPSQPPIDAPGPSSATDPAGPSAPAIEEDIYGADDQTPQSTLRAEGSIHTAIGPSAPALEDLHPSAALQPTEDKQELERRRLLAEASAPSGLGTEEEDNAGEGGSGAPLEEPSAPVLSEEDEYEGQYSHHSFPGSSSQGEMLPKYER